MKNQIAKSLLVLATLVSAVAAQAQLGLPTSSSSIVSSRVVTLTVDISPTNLKLSRADYSMPTVKVLVPELAAVSVMNHRNTREGAPCLATTMTRNPNDVIQDRPEIVELPFTITLTKVATPNEEKKICNLQLVEKVTVTIRGHEFSHERSSALPARQLADCL